jgi:hypothetical protein
VSSVEGLKSIGVKSDIEVPDSLIGALNKRLPNSIPITNGVYIVAVLMPRARASSHCNYRALQRDAAEGADAAAVRLEAVAMEAVVEEDEPTVGGSNLRRRPVGISLKRFGAGVERSQCGLGWIISSPVTVPLWYCVNIRAPACAVGCCTRLEVEVSNVQLIPRWQIPVAKTANAEIHTEVGSRVISNASSDHGSGVSCTIKGAGSASSAGVASFPRQACG